MLIELPKGIIYVSIKWTYRSLRSPVVMLVNHVTNRCWFQPEERFFLPNCTNNETYICIIIYVGCYTRKQLTVSKNVIALDWLVNYM